MVLTRNPSGTFLHMLLFPDGDTLLDFVNDVLACLERRFPVGGSDHYHHNMIAHLESSDAMDLQDPSM